MTTQQQPATTARDRRRTSLLPNWNEAILRPMPRGFQVVWDDEADHHILYHEGAPLAAHHNGFSCHNLAERLLAGAGERAVEQFDYIKACGGEQFVGPDVIRSLALLP
jgi:hypothetical protein